MAPPAPFFLSSSEPSTRSLTVSSDPAKGVTFRDTKLFDTKDGGDFARVRQREVDCEIYCDKSIEGWEI